MDSFVWVLNRDTKEIVTVTAAYNRLGSKGCWCLKGQPEQNKCLTAEQTQYNVVSCSWHCVVVL